MKIISHRTDADMDGFHPHFTMRTAFVFLLLILLQTSIEAQTRAICSAPVSVDFEENNSVGALVTTITVQPGVTVAFVPPPANPDNPFTLSGNQLIAGRVLDFETGKSHVAQIICTDTNSGLQLNLVIVVLVINLNDNPPVFDQNVYNIDVNEMSPVGTSVGHFAARDLDGNTIYYTLTPESSGFKLMSAVNPNLLVETPLDYDKVKNVKLVLHAQDTPIAPPSGGVSFTATATIMVTIVDVDNRPPWFQPCVEHEIGGALLCQSNGYTGRVNLNEQETGVLPLKPGPIYAIDGDFGINSEITYSFLNGNGDGLFEINPNTGNITMLKPADLLGPIGLTVLAAQRVNTYQFATTTVTIDVQVKSLHQPQFQRRQYDGVVSAVGTMAVDPKNKDKPLVILATDDDYASTGGRNPHIAYRIVGSSDFSIIDGFLFMTKDLPEGKLSLQVEAIDTSNDELATAELTVEVTSSLTTTSLPLSTTDSVGTTSTGESTISQTTEDIMSTSSPSMTTEIINSSRPTEDTASTARPHTVRSGVYGPEDMAAVGATLGVLLLILLAVIAVLAVHIKKDRENWKKIYQANRARNSLAQGSSGQKEDIQHVNVTFQDDEDDGSSGNAAGGHPHYEEVRPSMAPPSMAPPPTRDDISQAGSDETDSGKDLKPIAATEKRVDKGYRSVWFKQDIDPDGKDEVVIIPDSREDDSEEEDEEQTSSGREEDEDDAPVTKTPKVLFSDTDLDSGLGLKNSDDEEMMTEQL